MATSPILSSLQPGTTAQKIRNRKRKTKSAAERICSIEHSMGSQPEVRNIFEQVKTALIDPVVGIRIIKVTGDDSVGLYAAGLEGHSRITAHYHRAGSEIYQIQNGEGTLHTGIPLSGEGVAWNRPLNVRSGDCFIVKEGQVHQLENTGSLPMMITIVCPAAHLGDDRFMVREATHQ